MQMWYLSQNSRNFRLVNLDPLSVMMEFGTPNWWMMSMKNDTTCSTLRFMIGCASIHLENLSTVTNR
jgi:hypothetical protein